MSILDIKPTTELDAVNGILGSIGEAPINTLVGNLPLEAARARRKIAEQLRTILSDGWSFNTDTSVALTPDPLTGEIVLSPNVLDVQKINPRTLTWRGQRIYDPEERSFSITAEVTADLVVGLPFEELPEPARYYVYVTAGHKAQNETLGDEARERFTRQIIQSAWTSLMQWESRQRRYNLGTANQSVRRLFRRRG